MDKKSEEYLSQYIKLTDKITVLYKERSEICMKSYVEKHKAKLNPCKYCGETKIKIINNRFNGTAHCIAVCKCGAYVQRYCINPLLAPELEKTVIAIWNNGDISEPL